MTKLTQQFPFPVSKAPVPDVVEDSEVPLKFRLPAVTLKFTSKLEERR
jgi:hypothetical protein